MFIFYLLIEFLERMALWGVFAFVTQNSDQISTVIIIEFAFGAIALFIYIVIYCCIKDTTKKFFFASIVDFSLVF